MRLVDQFNEIAHTLVDDWAELRLELAIADEAQAGRVAALLGPASPERFGRKIRFAASRRGLGIAPEAARRLLRRLDDEGIDGELEEVSVQKAAPGELRRKPSLREQWEKALAAVPPDWSDLYAEVRLDSTDYLERAALLLAPANPARYGGTAGLRFRCARNFGYGVSAAMAARSLERCDDDGITGEVEILRVLSDTHPVGTQGPVWLVGGRVV